MPAAQAQVTTDDFNATPRVRAPLMPAPMTGQALSNPGWTIVADFKDAIPRPTVTLSGRSDDARRTKRSTTLRWSTSNAVSCQAEGDWAGPKSVQGSQNTGTLTDNAAYRLTCSSGAGAVTAADAFQSRYCRRRCHPKKNPDRGNSGDNDPGNDPGDDPG